MCSKIKSRSVSFLLALSTLHIEYEMNMMLPQSNIPYTAFELKFELDFLHFIHT